MEQEKTGYSHSVNDRDLYMLQIAGIDFSCFLLSIRFFFIVLLRGIVCWASGVVVS
jgi:hypothetical protein